MTFSTVTNLRAGWPGFDCRQERDISLLHRCFQTGSGTHPASYATGNWGSFPGGNATGAWRWPLTSI